MAREPRFTSRLVFRPGLMLALGYTIHPLALRGFNSHKNIFQEGRCKASGRKCTGPSPVRGLWCETALRFCA